MYHTVIFDLDGTLADTIGGIAAACNHALEIHGFPVHPKEYYKAIVGNGLALTIFRALPEAVREEYLNRFPQQEKLAESKEEGEISLPEAFIGPFMKPLIEYYLRHPLEDTRPYAGIPDVLSLLAQKNVKWGIHTNKTKEIAVKIADVLFGEYSTLGLSGPDAVTAKKPSPIGSLQLIGMEYSPDEVLFVGDTEVDVETAKNLGVRVACVSWGFRSREHLEKLSPDYILDEPMDLIKLML